MESISHYEADLAEKLETNLNAEIALLVRLSLATGHANIVFVPGMPGILYPVNAPRSKEDKVSDEPLVAGS